MRVRSDFADGRAACRGSRATTSATSGASASPARTILTVVSFVSLCLLSVPIKSANARAFQESSFKDALEGVGKNGDAPKGNPQVLAGQPGGALEHGSQHRGGAPENDDTAKAASGAPSPTPAVSASTALAGAGKKTSSVSGAADVGSIFAEDYQVAFEVGRSVDMFNRFGFLQLSFKVLPGVYAGKPEYIFIEKSFPVFTPESRMIQLYQAPHTVGGQSDADLQVHSEDAKPTFQVFACDSVLDVLVAYFTNFRVEGMMEPFKAFVPDFKKAKLSRSFGIDEKTLKADYRFLLIKVDIQRYSGVLDGDLVITDALKERVRGWSPESEYDCLSGVSRVGSHVIRHLMVGDSVFQVIAYTPSNFEFVAEALDGKTTLVADSLDKLKHVLTPHYAADFGKIMLAGQDRTALNYLRDQLWDFGVHTGRTPSIAALARHPKAVAAVRRGVGHVIIGAEFTALINYVPKTTATEFCKRVLFNAIQLYEANIM